jgi:O-antigen ligase
MKSAYLSGLARDETMQDAPGLIHPTHAGATAGLALFLIAVSSLGTHRFIRSPVLIAGISVVASYVLLAAASRTALIALFAAVAWVVATQLSIERRFKLAFAVAIVIAAVLTVDPGLGTVNSAVAQVQRYVLRGESAQLVKSATGRDELWKVLWASWKQSPWIGYGYFVGTRDGLVDVWNQAVNRPAHDIWLQSLVSLGIVGLVILVVALGSIAFLALHRSEAEHAPRSWIRSLSLGFGVWFVIWSSMDSSILGPVGPEPVTFFICMGLLVASTRFGQPASAAETHTLAD